MQFHQNAGILLEIGTNMLEWCHSKSYQGSDFRQTLLFTDPMEDSHHVPRIQVPAHFPCPLCDRMFVNAGGVRRHLTMIHDRASAQTMRMKMVGISNVCPWCAYRFTQMSSLKSACPSA
jgi:hypothetical protein